MELAKSQFIALVGVPEPPGSSSKHPKSESIGPVDVSEPQGAQNLNFGGLEAAIFDTFITSEASQGATGPNGRASTDHNLPNRWGFGARPFKLLRTLDRQ